MTPEEQAQAIYDGLKQAFGEPQWEGGDNPVDELIWTILSANTNDTNSGRAFRQLKATFGDDWEDVRLAPLDAIKDAIRIAGMYNQKAPAIVATLTRIREQEGSYTLDHLATLELDAAMRYLTSLPGVGHKTASIVLLFCFNRPAFPVDTHIQRISQRTGIAGPKDSPEKIKRIWESLLPGAVYYPLHLNLIRLGREICHARGPKCEICPIQHVCAYAAQTGRTLPSPQQKQ
jgi:endonuclease-3